MTATGITILGCDLPPNCGSPAAHLPLVGRISTHSGAADKETKFGFSLPWWDHLFGSYRAEPQAGHEAMTIGIAEFCSPRELRLDRMLLQPFRSEDGAYSIGRRHEAMR